MCCFEKVSEARWIIKKMQKRGAVSGPDTLRRQSAKNPELCVFVSTSRIDGSETPDANTRSGLWALGRGAGAWRWQ